MRPLVVALASLALAACGGADQDVAAPPATTASEPRAAPPIEGTTLTGERLSLADLRGRPVFVLVWSSW